MYSNHAKSSRSHLRLRMATRKRGLWTYIKTILFLIVLITILVNIWFVLNELLKANDSSNNYSYDHLGNRHQFNDNDHEDQSNQAQSTMVVEVLSSRSNASVTINGKVVLQATSDKERGIHIVVINQYTGAVMAIRKFDTYAGRADDLMIQFLDMISDDRILCFTILDEGTFSIRKPARQKLMMLGSMYSLTIKWRDMWAMIIAKNGPHYAESRSLSPKLDKWGKPCKVSAKIQMKTNQGRRCNWPKNDENRRRAQFCDQYEGYGQLCACNNPTPIDFPSPALTNNRVANVPVAVIASNRPYYLYRMLRSLLSAKGAVKSTVSVFIDGFFDEPLAVCKLFNIRAVQHKPISQRNGRIAQHYKASLSASFDLHPEAKYLIIVEEDLDIAVDFFSYFSQTLTLIDDKDIYCVSAWNDQGYMHSSNDPTQLYRVETMPGLGWMLKRSLFKQELEPHWPGPEALFDWDMWMRTTYMRKGRECVIPDVSRTFHFGSQGVNMNNYFQDAYFTTHKLNTDANAVLKNVENLRKDNYEKLIHKLIKKATVLNHTMSPCHSDFIPNTTDITYVIYIRMTKVNDYETWLQIAKCWKLWDLDVRGFHKAMWRLWMKKNPIFIVGYPVSPYASHKPTSVKPIFIKAPTKPPKKT